jgi:HAD superfamily hydrolase (TIGR01509 family)
MVPDGERAVSGLRGHNRGMVLRALCLDLMGVVLRDPYLQAIEAAVEVPLEAVWRHKDSESWPAFERAEIDEAEFERRFWAHNAADLAFDAAAFHRVRRSGYRFIEGMEELIADAADAELPLHVASNYPIWIEELRERFRLDERFDGVWASCHLGVRKPDPEFYRRLLEKVGFPAEACLFVDDREVNVAAARSVGMRAHLFAGAEDLRARLASEGVPFR